MVGELRDGLGHQRRRANALDAGHAPGPATGAMHEARVELDDAIGVG
jgi:hypothetical protein